MRLFGRRRRAEPVQQDLERGPGDAGDLVDAHPDRPFAALGGIKDEVRAGAWAGMIGAATNAAARLPGVGWLVSAGQAAQAIAAAAGPQTRKDAWELCQGVNRGVVDVEAAQGALVDAGALRRVGQCAGIVLGAVVRGAGGAVAGSVGGMPGSMAYAGLCDAGGKLYQQWSDGRPVDIGPVAASFAGGAARSGVAWAVGAGIQYATDAAAHWAGGPSAGLGASPPAAAQAPGAPPPVAQPAGAAGAGLGPPRDGAAAPRQAADAALQGSSAPVCSADPGGAIRAALYETRKVDSLGNVLEVPSRLGIPADAAYAISITAKGPGHAPCIQAFREGIKLADDIRAFEVGAPTGITTTTVTARCDLPVSPTSIETRNWAKSTGACGPGKSVFSELGYRPRDQHCTSGDMGTVHAQDPKYPGDLVVLAVEPDHDWRRDGFTPEPPRPLRVPEPDSEFWLKMSSDQACHKRNDTLPFKPPLLVVVGDADGRTGQFVDVLTSHAVGAHPCVYSSDVNRFKHVVTAVPPSKECLKGLARTRGLAPPDEYVQKVRDAVAACSPCRPAPPASASTPAAGARL